MKDHLIIGMGEIGKAVSGVLVGAQTVDLYPTKNISMPINTLHICFPYTKDFVNKVIEYLIKYKANYVIIYSTVPIGTCDKISASVAHSPIEGKHPDLELSIRTMERWVASRDKNTLLYFYNLFKGLGISVKKVKDPLFTEALKLLSTSEYGINIAFAAYKDEVASDIGMDYSLVKEWNKEYNRLYRELGYGKEYQKYVLEAPEGPIGGHCVVPNAKLLNADYPNDMLRIIEDMG